MKHEKGKGSNLTFPNAKQAMHVVQKKDKMAGNVGGSAHMSQGKTPSPFKGTKTTGGKKGGK